MTPREKRKRQKQREWRARSGVRKVHRFGFRGVTMSADARRMEQTSLCGANVNGMNGRGSRAVPDDSFIKLPRAFQCEACLATHWPGNWPPRIQRSGVRTHRMALEMLFASMQRLWVARLEVGHRCYVALYPHPNGTPAGYRRCACGRGTHCSHKEVRLAMATAVVPPPLVALDDARPPDLNYCATCLRPRGERHREDCLAWWRPVPVLLVSEAWT